MTSYMATPTESSTIPFRILVADDDEDMRELVVEAMRAEGYRVEETATGQGLLDRLSAVILDDQEDPFDLVISDIRMPLMSGTEILAGIRDLGCEMDFVLMSAFADEDTHREAAKLGAVAILDKPFELDRLRGLVRGLVRGRSRETARSEV